MLEKPLTGYRIDLLCWLQAPGEAGVGMLRAQGSTGKVLTEALGTCIAAPQSPALTVVFFPVQFLITHSQDIPLPPFPMLFLLDKNNMWCFFLFQRGSS